VRLRSLNTHKIVFYRRGVRQLVDGEYQSTSDTSLGTISGSLQPMAQGSRYGSIVKLLPSGIDSSSIYIFRTQSLLQVANRYTDKESDYCNLSDGVYEVFQVGDWGVQGFSTQHRLYVLTRRPDSSGGFNL